MKKTKPKAGLRKAVKSRKAGRQSPSLESRKAAKKRLQQPAAKKPSRRARRPRAERPAPREVGLLDAIGEVMATCEELGQEMRDWADNMPESKQGGEKHSEVEQAADTLEEQVGNDPTDSASQAFLNDVKITIQDPTPRARGYSRGARLGEATAVLMDVIEALDTFITEHKNGQVKQRETAAALAEELKSSLDEIESELQGVDFPGMYG